ncbi:thiol protease/hemagglutinin PrtT [Porphyromonas gingivicanis]|uniref:thiol protease/hemagglutinin PrtT n=1 Tax=Porphyromonas gingivicanis TaxID=266762 RepID=UPI00046FA1BA|nr:thiol protease/hemagglutinin PrtT [Porphyromonas gingivicanis]
MRKLFLSVFLLFWGTMMLTAGPVSPKEARAIAERFFSNSALRSGGTIELTYTHAPQGALRNGSEVQPYYYIFNRGTDEGFAIVAGDDRMHELLAYSDKGHFDMSKAPEHLLWWLGQYDIQINALLQAPWSIETNARSTTSTTTFRSSKSPLLEGEQILWDQDYPFNSKCPKDPVTGSRTYTGCVATAIGQVMRYHKWPDAGVGSHSYIDETYKDQGKAVERSATFGNPYNWDNIPANPSAGIPSAQVQELGQFLSDVGIAVNMQYSSQGSASWEAHVVRALKENFKYRKDLKLAFRVQYELPKWKELIQKELDQNRPVFYCGAGTGGGHAFVCDGYNADGKFHFNWGWSGNANGYYELTALKPGAAGIGAGSLGDYSLSQSIILNVMPDKGNGNVTGEDFGPNISLRAKVDANNKLNIKATLMHQGVDGAKIYFRPTLYKGTEVVKTGNLFLIDKMVLQELYQMNSTVDLNGLADGEYVLYIEHSYEENGTYRKVEEVLNEPSRARISIAQGKATVEGYNVWFTPLSVKDVEIKGDEVKAFARNTITLTLENKGDYEFYAPIRLYAYDRDLMPSPEFLVHTPLSQVGNETLIMIPKGGELKVQFSGVVGVKEGGKVAFCLQTPDLDPEDPSTDFGYYQRRLGNSRVRLIERDFIAKAPTTLMSPGITAVEVDSKEVVNIYTKTGLNAQGPKFKITNFGRKHTTSTHGNICGVVYAKHPPTGIYFVAEISSNSFKGVVDHGQTIEYSPTFTGSPMIAPFLGYEGVMVIACMQRFGNGGLTLGQATFGSIEVPIRFVKDTASDRIVPVLINSVFPNPASSECTVSNESEIASVDLFTLTGVKVRTFEGNGANTLLINVSDIENGTYLMGVRSTDGTLQSHRLIIQH